MRPNAYFLLTVFAHCSIIRDCKKWKFGFASSDGKAAINRNVLSLVKAITSQFHTAYTDRERKFGQGRPPKTVQVSEIERQVLVALLIGAQQGNPEPLIDGRIMPVSILRSQGEQDELAFEIALSTGRTNSRGKNRALTVC